MPTVCFTESIQMSIMLLCEERTPYKQVRAVSHIQLSVPWWTELATAIVCLQHIVNRIMKLWAKHD